MNADTTILNRSVIEMEHVSIGSLHQPGVTVLERVDWTVERGEFWVVVGHHASGKSDLLMTVAGLTPPAGGGYRLLGESMSVMDDACLEARLKVGLLFNGRQLLNQLTLGENVALPLRYHHDLEEASAREQAREVVQAMELTPWLDRIPGTVGRQWQQRAALARSLVMRPELLLLDDPLSGLDVRHTAWWVEFLRGLNLGKHLFHSCPTTLVVASDSLSPWRCVATHCAVLLDGKLFPLGRLSEREMWEHDWVREFLTHSRWTFDPVPVI